MHATLNNKQSVYRLQIFQVWVETIMYGLFNFNLIFTNSTQPAYSTGTGSMSSQDMYSRRSPAPFQGDRAPSGYGAGGPSHSAAPGGGGGYGGSNGAYGGSSGGYNGPPSSSGYG